MLKRNYKLEFDDEVVVMSATLPQSKKELSWSILVETYRDYVHTIKAAHQHGYADKTKQAFIKDVSFDYAPIFADDHAEGKVDLIGLGIDQMKNVSLPVMVLEAHQNDTWVLLPMVSANEITEDRQDAGNSYWCVKGDGSVFVECQYGAGVSVTWVDQLASYAYGLWEHHNAAEWHMFHGCFGSDSRLKCGAQVRTDTDNGYSGWGS
ncbi:hypothetical protein Cantr_02389 [Candida viswanathii]|uniref:Uncharacterized protein n=1 Tax=Candida viswanathii TaxID=5486 RepID=A0A367YPG3_9ASCO|nr:hypothetical protein Cantr_02389 [Candida viswanathii]